MKNKTGILAGYSGHGFVIVDAAATMGYNIAYYTDLDEKKDNPFNLQYLGNEKDSDFKFFGKDYFFILGIGDNKIREKTHKYLTNLGQNIAKVVHPTSVVSPYSKIGNGVFISAGAIIQSLADIGNSVILNTSCIIEHECSIGDFVHVAPGAVLAGNVKVGKRSFIGANAVIKEGVNIGDDVIIGAGTVVLNDIISKTTIVGNPGKTL